MLSTTVGETAADFLNMHLGLGLTLTSAIMAVLLIGALVIQFRSDRYVPWIYWLSVVLISVVGTLITDNLSDNLGVPLELTTAVFSILLAVTFFVWHRREHTLSIHTIYTRRREGFYWLAILFTFALGTAAGDLTSERLKLGYLVAALMFAVLIVVVAIAHFRFALNAVTAFWIAYVLTRPLGASIGDLLSQKPVDGGLGMGTTIMSAVFLLVIIALVIYLSVTRADRTAPHAASGEPPHGHTTPRLPKHK